MIFTERTITIRNDSSSINAPVILYRGDKNVEVRFTLVESPYKYSNRDSINIIESTDASYAQLVIKTPNGRDPIFGDITAVGQSNVIFMIGYDMIDEIEEVGTYDFQIRLFDTNQTSMATIPEVTGGFIIKEPIAKEDTTNNITNSAIVGSAVVTSDVSIPTFVGGSYNKTAWDNGTVISRQKLDKIEDGIYETYELSKDNSSQIKDKVDKATTDNIQQQVNNLVLGAVGDGNNPEVIQARGEFELLHHRLSNSDKYLAEIKNNVDIKYRLTFKLGSLSYGQPATNNKRIYSSLYISDSQIDLSFDYSKYRCDIVYYTDITGETVDTEAGWKTEKLTIDKNRYFRLLFSSGLTNDAETVISNCYDSDIYESIKMINGNVYSDRNYVEELVTTSETNLNNAFDEFFTIHKSKNLLDESKLKNVAISVTNGTEQFWTTYHTTDYIEVSANKIYKFSENEGQNTGCQYIAYYDNNKEFYSGAEKLSVLNPTKDGYVRLSKFTNGSMEGKRWQLEEVTSDNQSATFYVPYYVEKTVKAIPSSIKSELTKQGRLLSKNKYDSSLKSFIRVTVHRGKTSIAPENTIPAFEKALIDGYNSIETDVQFTSDNVPVLLHDDTIDRTSSGTGTLTSMTYADVSQYDFGSWKDPEYTGTKIPTLDDFIFFCKKNGVHPYIEIKNNGLTSTQADIIINICKKYNMLEYITFISFYKNNLFLLLEREPNLRIGILTDANNASNDLEKIKSLENGVCDLFLDVNGANITEDYFNIINSNGYNIEGWTYSTIPKESILKMFDGYTIDL